MPRLGQSGHPVGVTVMMTIISVFMSLLWCQVLCEDLDDGGSPTTPNAEISEIGRMTTGNEISVFPSTVVTSSTLRPELDKMNLIAAESAKKTRVLKFLRHFRLDFTKFDTTCLKREGRAIPAPPVPNARVTKYSRRRNRIRPRNHYAMALYECLDGFYFPTESADRMFCSKNKWLGPTPVCLPKGSLDESECSKCEQICAMDPQEESLVVCSCYQGFEMVNGHCVDIDECGVGNGGCSEICFNQPGSFQCFCPTGFQVGPDGKTCIDRNECLLRNGHGPCQDTCQNTPGSYICSCLHIHGTRLAPDKHSCEDVNECEEQSNFGCSHICLNTFGNAFCSCPKGLVLSTSDYKICLPDQADMSDPIGPPPPPENLELPDLPTDCPPGSAADVDNPRICVEHEDCSLDNGGCEHLCVPSGSFRFCTCRSGFELMNETACADVNECIVDNGGCEQECTNIPGGHLCSCKPGYTLISDERTCRGEFCDVPRPPKGAALWDCSSSSFSDTTGADVSLKGKKVPTGSQCVLRCLPGYHLEQPEFRSDKDTLNPSSSSVRTTTSGSHHSIVITCTESGNWAPAHFLSSSFSAPCYSSTCLKLPVPEDGSLFPDTCLAENVPVNTQCLVLCAPGFYPKNGRIRTCSKDFQWFPEDNPLCIRLSPKPRPYIHCPSGVEVDLKPGQNSAYVKIPQPQANMDWYRYVEADPSWAKNLEWEVPAGITHVTFIARSPISNDTATCHFKIHVVDREAPRVQGCPTSFDIRLSPGETAREVWWSEPKFTDNVKLHYVQQSHSPGHLLSRGTHHISFVAGDAEGNKARCSFTITVHGPEDYEMADYSYYPSSRSTYRHVVICPNLKTGRWSLHYAYYLPPGCRYHSQGLFSKLFKQNTYRSLLPRLRRRTLRH